MIIATAGHVDHGKTLLVKALTGVDTDRLPEEKRRSLTIDLGFAYLPVGASTTIGFIDVPGHERFIRNALCGLAGTDFVLFIVAADDGPMPQTREHLAIVDLLGISRGAIAVTKIDRVDEEHMELVRDEIAELFAATSLADAPLFPVSAMTGDGIAALQEHLKDCAQATPPRATTKNFRLAIDRRFDVVGAGLVATGTVFSGRLDVGDQVAIAGADMNLRVRGIHAQNAQSETASAGQRCALNLAGTELRKDQINRGDWVATGNVPAPARKIDGELAVLKSETRALGHWTPVHVHLGAAETTGRVAVLEAKNLAPGETGLVQLVLDGAIGAVHGDRYIIRDQSARRTIGGGRVIDIFPPKRGRSKPDRIAWLRAMAAEDDEQALRFLLALSNRGVELSQFGANRNLTPAELAAIEKKACSKVIAAGDERIGFSKASWSELRATVVQRMKEWHDATPGTVGLGENRILQGTGIKLAGHIAAAISGELVRDGALVREDLGVRLPSHSAQLQGADAKLWPKVERAFAESKLRPLTAREVGAACDTDFKKMEALLNRAGRLGKVARISKTRYALPAGLRELGHIAENLAASAQDETLMVQAFRDASGIGRNMTIEILEYFDRQKFTQRVGEGRKIVQTADKVFGTG